MSTFLHGMASEYDTPTEWHSFVLPDDDQNNLPADMGSENHIKIAVPPDTELKKRAETLNLYDARFLSMEYRDTDGDIQGYGIECIELYRDPKTNQLSGKVLPIGNFEDAKEAEAKYVSLQSQVGKEVPVYRVGTLGEQTVGQNGLQPQWYNASRDDVALYLEHRQLERQEIIAPSIAIPDKPVVFTVAEASAINNNTLDENEQARNAIREIGLEPPKDFDLNRDSLLDQRTGIRCVPGVFQQDLADKTANCQATLIALGSDTGVMQAEAVAVGQGGSFAQARDHWEQVNSALYREGPSSALRAIEQIDQQIRREMPVPADLTGPSAQEIQALSNTLDLS